MGEEKKNEEHLMWVKMRGYPYWPAKFADEKYARKEVLAARKDTRQKLVYFFGSHDFGWFNQEEVMPWTENYERFISKSKAKNFLAAIEEAQSSTPNIEVDVMRKDKESEIRHETRRTQGLSSSSESEVEQELGEKAESESENEDENENENEDEYEDKMDIDKVEDDVIQEEKPNKKKKKENDQKSKSKGLEDDSNEKKNEKKRKSIKRKNNLITWILMKLTILLRNQRKEN